MQMWCELFYEHQIIILEFIGGDFWSYFILNFQAIKKHDHHLFCFLDNQRKILKKMSKILIFSKKCPKFYRKFMIPFQVQ